MWLRPPANHDPLPDNIQGNCLLTPPTFHPINADNGFVEQFHKVFPPPVRSVVFCCLILALLLVEIRHVSPKKLPQGRDRQSSSIQDLGWNQSHITRPSREVCLTKKQNICLEWYLRAQHSKKLTEPNWHYIIQAFSTFCYKFLRVAWKIIQHLGD